MVRVCEVKFNACGKLYIFISVEFSTVVSCDGFNSSRVLCNELTQATIHFFYGPSFKLADESESRFAFCQSQNAVVCGFA